MTYTILLWLVTNDNDIFAAIKEVEKLKGGLIAVAGGSILTTLNLHVTGLLSNQPLENVIAALNQLEHVAS